MFLDPRLRIIKHRGTGTGKAEQSRNSCKGLKRAKTLAAPRKGKKARIAISNRERMRRIRKKSSGRAF